MLVLSGKPKVVGSDNPACHTVTLVVVLEVQTGGSVLTGKTVTLVHLQLTVVSVISRQTGAPVLPYPVLAGPSIEAGLVRAVVDVDVAGLAVPALLALTLPVVDQVLAETSLAARILQHTSQSCLFQASCHTP